jgi:hypothetical protein
VAIGHIILIPISVLNIWVSVGIFTCGRSMEGRADTPIESCKSLCTNTLFLLGSISIYGSRTSMFGLPCDAGTHILSRCLSQHSPSSQAWLGWQWRVDTILLGVLKPPRKTQWDKNQRRKATGLCPWVGCPSLSCVSGALASVMSLLKCLQFALGRICFVCQEHCCL